MYDGRNGNGYQPKVCDRGDFSEVRDAAYYKEKLEGLPINQVNRSNILHELEINIKEDGSPSGTEYLKEVLKYYYNFNYVEDPEDFIVHTFDQVPQFLDRSVVTSLQEVLQYIEDNNMDLEVSIDYEGGKVHTIELWHSDKDYTVGLDNALEVLKALKVLGEL